MLNTISVTHRLDDVTNIHDDAEFFDATPEADGCLRPIRAHECNGATPGSCLVFLYRGAPDNGARLHRELTTWPPVGPRRLPLNKQDAPLFLRMIRQGLNGPQAEALPGILARLYLQNCPTEGSA